MISFCALGLGRVVFIGLGQARLSRLPPGQATLDPRQTLR